jgi:hypothetical protein
MFLKNLIFNTDIKVFKNLGFLQIFLGEGPEPELIFRLRLQQKSPAPTGSTTLHRFLPVVRILRGCHSKDFLVVWENAALVRSV